MPDMTMINQAAESSNPLQQLQQYLLERVKAQPSPQTLSDNRQSALVQYQNSLRQAPMGNYTGTEHSLYNWVKNIGRMPAAMALNQGIAAGGDWVKANQEGLVKGDQMASKVGYDDANTQDKENIAMFRGLSGLAKGGAGGAGKFIQFKDDKGNLYIMNNATGQKEVIPSSGTDLWKKVYTASYNKAVAEEMENPEDYAVQNANAAVRQSPQGVAPVDTAQKPVAPVGGSVAPVAPEGAVPEKLEPSISADSDKKQALLTEWEVASKQFKIYQGDPSSKGYNEALRNMAEIRKELLKEGIDPTKQNTASAQPGVGVGITQPAQNAPVVPGQGLPGQPAAPAPGQNGPAGAGSIAYKDKITDAQKPEIGKNLQAESKSMRTLFDSNNTLFSQLNTMHQIYDANPNIPEGDLAPHIQKFRSGLKSLGVEVDSSVGDAQVFDALAKKMALQSRTAGGENLMPGAMSNYEDQLLQSLGPQLAGTREGNMKLMRVMMEVAKSNMRLSEKMNSYMSDKGIVDPKWFKDKELEGKRETLRLDKTVRAILEGK